MSPPSSPSSLWHWLSLRLVSPPRDCTPALPPSSPLTAFLLAHLFRSAELTWLGSTFVFAAIAHLLIWNFGVVARRARC